MSAPWLARVQFLPFYWNDHAHYLILLRGQCKQHNPHFSSELLLLLFLFLGILSHLVLSVVVKCEGWVWEDECYQRGLSCTWSREKSCRWLAACLRSNMARDPHRRGETMISGWSCAQYVDFWAQFELFLLMCLLMSRRKRGGLLFWFLDVVIFPLCRLSHQLPEVPGSQCNKWRSQSLFIIALTFNIKNTFKHDWMFDGVILWLCLWAAYHLVHLQRQTWNVIPSSVHYSWRFFSCFSSSLLYLCKQGDLACVLNCCLHRKCARHESECGVNHTSCPANSH